jgi:hypothetical protein
MARISTKFYRVSGQPDGTYAIHVTEDAQPAGTIFGFLTMERALEECARLNAEENERRRNEDVSNA